MAVPTADKRSLLLIVDMVSDYSFPDADQLLENAQRPARHIRQARDAADAAGVLVVYANDIRGLWSCSREEVCERALNGRRPDLVTPLLPRPGDVPAPAAYRITLASSVATTILMAIDLPADAEVNDLTVRPGR